VGDTGPKWPTARPFVPQSRNVESLRRAAAGCKGCDLYKNATQTVFGRGPSPAAIMVLGEQPGDQEDRQGLPFVGPAGEVLARALEEAGILRDSVFVSNVVKHFKWEPRGKRRIHQTPRISEIKACQPWTEAEIEAVGPQVIVCLGATAAKALMGSSFRITQSRGQLLRGAWDSDVIATWHPSAILRAHDDPAQAQRMFDELSADLRLAARHSKTKAKTWPTKKGDR
jgi:DNA polymerase